MSLSLPANFRSDIQGRDTNLFPIVIIGNLIEGSEDWKTQCQHFSTNSMVLDDVYFKPLLLSIPSLKESTDIEKRNYKISNVTLTLSNAPYNGERLSDIIGNPINRECRILWASPSTTTVYLKDVGTDPYRETDAFQVYFGTVRRYDHDDETVKLLLEDRSQATLHKDLPLPENHLGTDDSIPDKYKNKPIPMVYGHVDKSPCVIASTGDDGESISQLFIDNDPVHSVVSEPNLSEGLIETYIRGCLYASDGEGYAHCANIFPETTTLISDIVEAVTPIIEGHPEPDIPPSHTFNAITSYVDANYIAEPSNGIIKFTPSSTNDTGKGILRGLLRRKNLNVTFESHIANGDYYNEISNNDPENYNFENNTGYIFHADSDSFGERGEGLLNIINGNYTTGCAIRDMTVKNNMSEWAYFKISVNPVSVGYHSDTYFAGVFYREHGTSSSVTNPKNYPHVYMLTNISPRSLTVEMGAGVQWWAIDNNNHGGKWFSNVYEFSLNDDGNPNSSSQTNIFTRRLLTSSPPSSINSFGIGVAPYETVADPTELPVNIDVWDANIFHVTYVKDLLSQDFYADVRGRINESGTLIFKPEDIINDILTSELKVPTSNIDYESFVSYDNYNLWEHAFTVNKKINSKKLIENIASTTPYIPRFDNMGSFKFSIIPQEPTSSDITIKNDDVIDFSFSRTKIEDVYTKVEFKYNWDYAREEFNSSVESDIELLGSNDDDSLRYDPEYYGFEMPDTLIYDHAETTLIIDDDRSKYIRDPNTAQAFCDWFLLWSCNQHLKMKVRLPLKYMEIEIADMVEFDELLGGIVPYGIDYVNAGNWEINGQQFYKYFMVSSTNKTLEYVEIECIQMHNLEGSCDTDCNNVCGGTAYEDVCGQCVTEEVNYTGCGEQGCDGIPEGYCDCDGNVLDCAGECGGNASQSLIYGCECGAPVYQCNNGDFVCDQAECEEFVPTLIGCIHSQCEDYNGDNCTNPDDGEDCTSLTDPLLNYSTFSCCPSQIVNLATLGLYFNPPYDFYNKSFNFNSGDRINLNGNFGWDWSFTPQISSVGSEMVLNGAIEARLGYYYENNPIINLDSSIKIGDYDSDGNFIEDEKFQTPDIDTIVFNPDEHILFAGGVDQYSFNILNTGDKLFTINGELDTDYKTRMLISFSTVTTEGDFNEIKIEVALTFNYCAIGDVNGDFGWDVLDIVTLVTCILEENCGCAADLNGDEAFNVLDLTTLATCVLGENCGG